MKDEIWLQKFKKRLDDYSEPVPPSGWERLEASLPKPKQSHRLIPLRRWMTTVAAALLMGAVVLIGLRLTNQSVPEKQGAMTELNPTESPMPSSADGLPMLPQPSRPLGTTSEATRPTHALALLESSPTPKEETEVYTVPEESATDTGIRKEERPTTPQEETHFENKKKQTNLPKTNEQLLAMAESRRSRSSKGWSFSLSAGNTGGFNNALDNSGMQALLQNSPGTGYQSIDLTATSNGIIAIPAGQEVVFKDGVPYLQNNGRHLLSADHKQPVSVGFSVRKNLPKGFSIETGLVYTYLASDLYFQDFPEKTRQKLHYLGIPVRANWDFLDKRYFTLYLSAGGMIEKCVYGKVGTETEIVDPVQLSVMASIGAQYNVSQHVGIYVEPGISYYFDDGSKIQTIRKENPCNFTLQAGLRLTY